LQLRLEIRHALIVRTGARHERRTSDEDDQAGRQRRGATIALASSQVRRPRCLQGLDADRRRRRYFVMRHIERSRQLASASVAQAVPSSLWQTLQAFGICSESVSLGVTKWNVWLLTLMSAIVCSIFGMWQATHWLPGLLAS
jgi:hypothetical protein